MLIQTITGYTLFIIFIFLAGVHVYWAFGGKWGSEGVIPVRSDDRKPVMPGVVPTLAVAAGLFVFGFFVLVKSGQLTMDLPGWLNSYGLYVMAGIFFIRAIGEFRYLGFFKKITNTRFARNDTKFYSPLCLVIGMLSLFLAVYTSA